MKARRAPMAAVRVLLLPQIAPDAIRIEVDCRYSTTGMTSVPSDGFPMTRRQLITAAIFEHEQRCGQCDTTEAHKRGDQLVRTATDRAWNDVQAAVLRRRTQDRRN
jgi:hypothetical protein